MSKPECVMRLEAVGAILMTDWKKPPNLDEPTQIIVPNGSTGYCSCPKTKVTVVGLGEVITCSLLQCQYFHLIHRAKVPPKFVGRDHDPAKIVCS